ncbi:response regulator transcription factor [bacterium]|jgi:DNA-binding NarL/FixJ family response regulator|nr:response regulator transcription factor [Verrucomicrobiota bacterium]MDA7497113.1 response regulator transcription factor [bacterium]MDA7510768.1 response regulator transcription factor [Verrucomicrobiota bacterium]MDA7657409.1 response regulator transcription factor [Verrucomicrobiota bacterium]MDA7680476.1 response regulator transcription factor [bacterium]
MKPIRTVIIEDQELLRNVLVKTLEMNRDFDLLGDCADGKAGQILCLDVKPDLVVTDIDMPELDGISMAQTLIQELPAVRVLALSNLKDPFTISRLRETGIHGYVEKDQPLDILEEAMRTVAKGEHYFTALVKEVSSQLAQNPIAFSKILSRREQDVVRFVVDGLTSKEIARKMKLVPRSVETHRYRIMKKLELKNVVDLIAYAEKNGLRRPDS